MKKTFIRTLSVLACASLLLGACSLNKGKEDPNKFNFFNSLEEAKLLTFDNLEEIKEEDAEPLLESLLKETQSVDFKMEMSGHFVGDETKITQKGNGKMAFYQDDYFESTIDIDVDVSFLGTKLPSMYSATQSIKGAKLSGHILSVQETKPKNEEHLSYSWNKQSIYDPEDDVRSYQMKSMLEELGDGDPIGKMVTKTAEYWVLMDYDKYTNYETDYAGETFAYQEV